MNVQSYGFSREIAALRWRFLTPKGVTLNGNSERYKMSSKPKKIEAVVFSPNLRADDELANFWMRQATIRLRREIAWLWQERGLNAPSRNEQLPLFTDKLSVSLDLTRHWAEKQNFFERDVTAKYLSESLCAKPPAPKNLKQGSFGWAIRELELEDVAVFALALALGTVFDANMGSVIAACLNDGAKIYPNLMLVQRLWDAPEAVLDLADPLHPLFSFGLLSLGTNRFYAENFWEQPLTVSALVARRLLGDGEVKTEALSPVSEKNKADLTEVGRLVAYRLKSDKPEKLRLIPLLSAKGAACVETVAGIAHLSKREVLKFDGDEALLENKNYLNALTTLCWLENKDLFIKAEIFGEAEKRRSPNEDLPLISLPVNVFLSISEGKQIGHIDAEMLLPIVKIPPLSYAERLQIWQTEFGAEAKKYQPILSEIARRFRYEKETIRKICAELKTLPKKPDDKDFIAACRAELNLDIGELAAAVTPRFDDEELILPPKQTLQFEEQLTAMRSLTKVHYGWGTAKAWNEGGITILFAGPSGTGKTMAAEIMAFRLNLPMFRVDLSQVVNKYIGETEKNLKRIFDAADISDMVLFFDEADSLFGKRTEVSHSNDRFANQEISYLLERMERFKGLAILATNQKKALDGAFLRRLRDIIDFPLPETEQRKKIWAQVIPKAADISDLNLDFLARQFPLAGGNIRSIVFNACLQSAAQENGKKLLLMKDVLVAVKREYDKMNRVISPEQFGIYAKDIAFLEK